MGQTTFSGPVRSERGFTAVGSTAVVNITAETTLTYADHVGRIIEVNDADGAVTLPSASTDTIGAKYTFFIGTTASDLDIKTDGTDKFVGMVVVAAAAKHLHATLNFVLAPDQRIDITFASLGIQVDAVFCERRFLVLFLSGRGRLRFLLKVRGTADGPAFAKGWILGDAMRDKGHGIIAGHILRLQEVGSVGFALGENGDKDVCPGHFCPA